MILQDHVGDFQLGSTKVFLRENLERVLEHERATILRHAAVILQRNIRGFLARKHYVSARRSAVRIQSAMRLGSNYFKVTNILKMAKIVSY